MTQSSTSSNPLYIFTTSQTPLAARYSRPSKPTLNVPPLIHRSLHQALDQSPPSITKIEEGIIIPHPDQLRKHDIPVSAEHDQVEVTLKVHLVGDGSAEQRSGWVEDALRLVETHLGLGGADTLLIGFKGVDYKGKKTSEGDVNANTNTNTNTNGDGEKVAEVEYSISPKIEEHIIEFWSALRQRLQPSPSPSSSKPKPKVKDLGTMYLPLNILKRLKEADSGLAINSMDTPDCHHLPKDFTTWAKTNEVQLWAGGGGEGSDPLPSSELHNILQEFTSHLPSIQHSSTPLTKLIPLKDDGKWDESAPRGVEVRWVLGYTVVSSTRNVVEDKGYIVAADLLA